MTVTGQSEIEARLTALDPDWAEHFPDWTLAAKFYRAELNRPGILYAGNGRDDPYEYLDAPRFDDPDGDELR